MFERRCLQMKEMRKRALEWTLIFYSAPACLGLFYYAIIRCASVMSAPLNTWIPDTLYGVLVILLWPVTLPWWLFSTFG